MNRAASLALHDMRLAEAPISFSVEAGECVALLASDRVEASRLVDTVTGHRHVGAGGILVDGREVTRLPPGQRRIGIVSERDPLFGHLSVRDNVAFPLAVRRLGKAERAYRAQQAISLLDIDRQADHSPGALDPAGTVRAKLARALVCNPAVVVLDDPLARVAFQARGELRQSLRRLARARGLGVLLATPDRDEALAVGDRIGLLQGSILRQLGSASELLDHPADEGVAVAFGEANSLTGRIEWVEDDVARVRLSAGPSMEAMASCDLAAGALCVVCVRPERIAVAFVSGEADGLGGDALAGTLSDVMHLGDHLRLRFRLAGGGELLVRRPAAQPTAALRADRPALLAWQAAHAIAFPLGE